MKVRPRAKTGDSRTTGVGVAASVSAKARGSDRDVGAGGAHACIGDRFDRPFLLSFHGLAPCSSLSAAVNGTAGAVRFPLAGSVHRQAVQQDCTNPDWLLRPKIGGLEGCDVLGVDFFHGKTKSRPLRSQLSFK